MKIFIDFLFAGYDFYFIIEDLVYLYLQKNFHTLPYKAQTK